MTRLYSITTAINSNYHLLIYGFGVLICILWLLVTPTGILGKADAIGYAVCHRIDTRSFHIGVRQLPLCVRCTGQYIGAAMGLVFLSIFGRQRTGTPPKRVVVWMIIVIILYAIDGLNSYLYLPPFLSLFPGMPHLYEPSSVLRLLTGTGMGLVIAIVLYPALFGTVLVDPKPQPVIKDLRSFFIMLGMSILVDMVILNAPEQILFAVALLSTSGVLILLSMVYTILWIRIIHKENQFIQFSQIIGYIIVGFMITMIQIAFFDLIRFIITGSWNGIFFD